MSSSKCHLWSWLWIVTSIWHCRHWAFIKCFNHSWQGAQLHAHHFTIVWTVLADVALYEGVQVTHQVLTSICHPTKFCSGLVYKVTSCMPAIRISWNIKCDQKQDQDSGDSENILVFPLTATCRCTAHLVHLMFLKHGVSAAFPCAILKAKLWASGTIMQQQCLIRLCKRLQIKQPPVTPVLWRLRVFRS